jgi:hypothetical protein
MQSGADKTIVVVAYRPKVGKEAELEKITREHVPLLRREGLATDRAAVVAKAADGTVVEVFEWTQGGVERAHSNPAVLKLWEQYAAACEIVPLTGLAESSTMFASFTPMDLN